MSDGLCSSAFCVCTSLCIFPCCISVVTNKGLGILLCPFDLCPSVYVPHYLLQQSVLSSLPLDSRASQCVCAFSQSQRVEEPLTPTSHAKAQFEATWAKAERAVSADNGFADVLSPTSRSVKQFEDSMTRASLLEQ